MDKVPVRHAAWIARCLGRGLLAPVDPDDVDALASAMGERRHAEARPVDLLASGLQAQLASLLVREVEQGRVRRLSQQVLAALVGGRCTGVNRVLRQLEARQLIKLRYRQVEILDPAGLAALTGTAAAPVMSPVA